MKKLHVNVRVAEADGLATVLLEGFAGEAGLQGDAFLAGVFAEMRDLSDKLSEAANKSRAASELEGLDIARDEALRSLGRAISGYAAVPVPELSERGEALQKIFAKCGAKAADLGYSAETGAIESLLADLDAGDVAAHIEALAGMPPLLAALKKAQGEFVEAQVRAGKASAAEKDAASASEIRKPLVALVNERLVPYLNMMSRADKERFGAFAAFVEGEIEKMNRTISARKGR